MMSKRVIALLLCLLMCMTALLGCSERIKADADVKGAYITMFLTDEVYNFDPALAYMNEEAESIVSLLFARLFYLDADGKLKKDLATEYEINEDDKTKEYTMTITIRDAWWSDKIQLTADDVVYAWKRILNSENAFACASLLFDLKNARAVKAGNCSVDDLGVCALNDNTLQITFEKPIDYDQFLINLTSLALVPLREDYVSKSDDWAKKPGTMVTSGPFKLSKTKFAEDEKITYKDINGTNDNGEPFEDYRNQKKATYSILVLERNACYLRDPQEKDLDLNESVEPYRIIIYCAKSAEDLLAAFNGGVVNTIDVDGLPETTEDIYDVCGDLFYMGSIPLALRTNAELMDKAKITNALSTMSFYLNENVLIKNQSTKEEVALFANADVRLALSLALDRNTIAETLVLADAATGLVPEDIFNKGNKGSFRKEGGDLISTSASATAAQEALARAGVGTLDLIDNDDVAPSNINRQIIALHSTVGMPKVDAAAARVKDINPSCIVNCHQRFVLPENLSEFDLASYDYIVDAIDTVSSKIALAVECEKLGVKLISSMGTGNKLDPTKFEVADIYKTSVCPLARVMRTELKKRGVKGLKVLYSMEEPIKVENASEEHRRAVPASISFVPSCAGLIIAGEVIKDLIK